MRQYQFKMKTCFCPNTINIPTDKDDISSEILWIMANKNNRSVHGHNRNHFSKFANLSTSIHSLTMHGRTNQCNQSIGTKIRRRASLSRRTAGRQLHRGVLLQ